MEQQTLVIVGNGMMSFRLCQKLVACGAAEAGLRIIVFGEEPRPAYDRIHLTELFSGKRPEELCLAPESYYAANGIELHLGDPVVTIDRDACLVRGASGIEVLFDRLVLATGARPLVPPIAGTSLPGVFVYRTIDDVEGILACRTASRAAILGGGLLGLEAARAVRDLGLEVHVIESAPRLLSRQLDDVGAAVLRERIEAMGVRVRTSTVVQRIAPQMGERSLECVLHFADGGRLPAEVVIIAAGVRPRGDLARAAGLAVADNGGVIVDDHLATSDPRIFAVGDCAAHRGTVYGLALPGYQMIDVLVDNLVGGDAGFKCGDISTTFKLLGISVASLGRALEPDSRVHVYQGNGVYRKLVVQDDRVVGAIAVGGWEDLDRVRDAIAEPRRISFWDMRRFRSTGSLGLKSESALVHEWPAEALVCGCRAVRRGVLSDAETAGATTVEELSNRTGAGTMCGSCKPLLAEFLTRRRLDSVAPVRAERLGVAEDTPPTLRCSGIPSPPRFPAMPSDLVLGIPPPSLEPIVPPMLAPLWWENDPLVASSSGVLLAVGTVVPVVQRPRMDTLREAQPASTQRPRQRPDVKVVPTLIPGPPSSSSRPSSRRDSMQPLRPLSAPTSSLAFGLMPRPPSSAPQSPRARLRQPLVIAGVAAVAGALALSLAPGLSPTDSIRGIHLVALADARTWKLVSGYGILVLATASLVLSLRKRWSRFAYGSVHLFRAVHSAIGVSTLLLLAFHTGLRPGMNLNRALLIDVLALTLLGGVAAVVTAYHDRSPQRSTQNRRLLATHAHLLLLMPTPVLVTLHILCAYYF